MNLLVRYTTAPAAQIQECKDAVAIPSLDDTAHIIGAGQSPTQYERLIGVL